MNIIWNKEDKEKIIALLKDISDKDFQKRAWFNIGPEVSSPDEDICMLYDDHNFEVFLNDVSSPLNKIEREQGLIFCSELNAFLESHDISDPDVVFNSKDWNNIREKAQKLIELWN